MQSEWKLYTEMLKILSYKTYRETIASIYFVNRNFTSIEENITCCIVISGSL